MRQTVSSRPSKSHFTVDKVGCLGLLIVAELRLYPFETMLVRLLEGGHRVEIVRPDSLNRGRRGCFRAIACLFVEGRLYHSCLVVVRSAAAFSTD